MEERRGGKGNKEEELNCPGFFFISFVKKAEPKLSLK